jgi:membrane protein YdbS with pleckstrin-like domain
VKFVARTLPVWNEVYMYCKNCGQALPDGSRFCNHCGATISGPDALPAAGSGRLGYPEGSRSGPPGSGLSGPARDVAFDSPELAADQVVFTVRPTMLFVWVWYIIASLIVLAATVVVALLAKTVSLSAAVVIILIVAAVAFSMPIYKHIVRRREVFTLTNHKLEMRYGIIARTVRNIPLRNIQDVTVTATAIHRLLGIGSIVIDSASESGKIWLSQVPHPDRYADLILAEMRRRY